MQPVDWRIAARVVPGPRKIEAEALIAPAALRSHNHLYGDVAGRAYHVPDVNSYAWWEGANLDAPVRVELAETASRLFSDARIALTYFPSLPLNPGSEYYINTAYKEQPEYTFTPVKLDREMNGLHSLIGETVMGRLARTYPRSTILKQGPFTAIEAVLQIINTWKQEGHTWLRIGGLPDLYLPGTNGRVYEPTISAITVIYDDENPRSMQDILREYIDSFPGYYLRADNANRLELVAPPWLPLYYQQALTAAGGIWRRYIGYERGVSVRGRLDEGGAASQIAEDLVPGQETQISAGASTLTVTYTDSLELRMVVSGSGIATVDVLRPHQFLAAAEEEERAESTDTTRVINRATVRVDGAYEYVSGQPVVDPSYFTVWGYGPYCYPVISTFAHPTSADLGNPTERDMGNYHVAGHNDPAAACHSDVPYWQPVGLIPAQPNTILGGDAIKLSVTVSWWADQCGDLADYSHIGDSVYTDIDVPLHANAASVMYIMSPINCIPGSSCAPGYLVLSFKPLIRNGVFEGLYTWWAGRLYHDCVGWPPPGGDGHNILGVGVFVSATGERWQESNKVLIGQWGYNADTEDKATPGISESQATYGVRERVHHIKTYMLEQDTVQDIARALCQRALNPIKVFHLQQYPPYKYGPSDIMAGITLYTGEKGHITEWRYSEQHVPSAAMTRSSITVEIYDNIESENIKLSAWDELAWRYGRWYE